MPFIPHIALAALLLINVCRGADDLVLSNKFGEVTAEIWESSDGQNGAVNPALVIVRKFAKPPSP